MDITGRRDWKNCGSIRRYKRKNIQQTRQIFIKGFGMVNEKSELFNEPINNPLTSSLVARAMSNW